jgi:hypothetical protein
MKIGDVYPSRYLAADNDIPEEGNRILTIDRVEVETLGQGKDAEDKPVAYFKETDKGLVLNKTNWNLIVGALKLDDSDDWVGRKIALYSTDVQFGNETKRGIRVMSKAPKGAAANGNAKPEPAAIGAPAKSKPAPAEREPGEDDDIIF